MNYGEQSCVPALCEAQVQSRLRGICKRRSRLQKKGAYTDFDEDE